MAQKRLTGPSWYPPAGNILSDFMELRVCSYFFLGGFTGRMKLGKRKNKQ